MFFFCYALRQLLRPNSEYILPSTASRHICSITFTVNSETYVRCKHDRFRLQRNFNAYVTTIQLFRFYLRSLIAIARCLLEIFRLSATARSISPHRINSSLTERVLSRPLLWRLSFAVYISLDT